MTYPGILNGTQVIPQQVAAGTTVTCPTCDLPMAVVRSHERGSAFISRHFWHHEQEDRSEMGQTAGQATFADLIDVGQCPGESDKNSESSVASFHRSFWMVTKIAARYRTIQNPSRDYLSHHFILDSQVSLQVHLFRPPVLINGKCLEVRPPGTSEKRFWKFFMIESYPTAALRNNRSKSSLKILFRARCVSICSVSVLLMRVMDIR